MRLRNLKKFEPKTARQLVMPLSFVNWLFGIGVFEYPLGRPRPVLSFLYIFLLMGSFCTLMFMSMDHLHEWYITTDTPSESIIYRAIFYVNIGLAFVTIILGWTKSKSVKRLVSRLDESDERTERIGIPKLYHKFFIDQLVALLILCITILAFMVITYEWMLAESTPLGMKIGLTLTLQYPPSMMYMVDMTFASCVRHIGNRFHQLNDLLRGMLTTTADSPQHKRVLKMYSDWDKNLAAIVDPTRKTREDVIVMRKAKQVHLELVKLARAMNDLYGFEILLSMTVAFVLITGLLYNVYIIVWLDLSREVFEKEIISLSCWIFFYVSKIVAVNHVCATTSNAAATTGDVICELYEPSTSAEFRAEIRDFTLQLIQNPLTFTASGFFNMDYTFIHGVIGSVTTYLVILIQFSDLSQASSPSSKTKQN